jgi:lysophospholipase L1-like esterase
MPMNPPLVARSVSGALMLLIMALLCPVARAGEQKSIELQDGDVVAFIGNTFVEREQSYSYLETLLRTRWPDRKISFRNLGWSGDTVYGASRGYFEGADAGFARLTKIVHGLKPTVIFIGYGMGESFDGEAGLPGFRSGLERMLDMLKPVGARETVLIGPIQHEKLPPPLPDPAEHNTWLRAYADAMKEIAKARGHRFVDLYDLTAPSAKDRPLTDNGIHLNPRGYWQAARAIEAQLGLRPSDKLSIDPAGGAVVLATRDGPSDQFERLRQLAVQKNVQFFNQWRPANETYIFGFRAYEQGKNAAEMPKFAEPIAKLEDEITRLAKPPEPVYELNPQ